MSKEGWREAPGWFDAVIPPLIQETYISAPTGAGCVFFADPFIDFKGLRAVMSLQAKVIHMIFIVFLLYAAVDYAAQCLLILPSFEALEHQEAQKDMDRVVQAIENEEQHLINSAADWATWDDTYQFVQDRNDAYQKSNLGKTAMNILKVSLIYFFDAARHPVWGDTVDLLTKERVSMEVFPSLLPVDHPLVLSEPGAEMKGILLLAQGPMLIAAKPVVTSENKGPVRGSVVLGRFLDAAAIAAIAEQARVELTVSLARDPGLSPEQAAAIAELGVSNRSLIHDGIDTERVYRVLPDLFGRPALLLQVDVPKTISVQGQEAVRFALLSLFIAGLIILIVLVIGIRHLVLIPVQRLTRHAVAIGQQDDLTTPLMLDRSDELGVLGQEFDRMIERLAQARKALIDQSYESGLAEIAGGLLHNIGNAMTPLIILVTSLNSAIRNAPTAELQMALTELADASTPADRRGDLEQFVALAGQEIVTLLDSAVEQLSRMEQQVTHVQQILGEQERFSRAHRVLEPLPVAELVNESLKLSGVESQRQIQIEPSPNLPVVGAVVGARVVVQQILVNLLKNAVEAIQARSPPPETGLILVDADLDHNDSGDRIHLRVIDNGAGIAPESLPHIFKRGFSTKNRDSSGIGLHWCAITILALGGKLYAESAGPGQGACMHLLLPQAKPRPASLLATGD